MISQPTRVTPNFKTLIDHIYTSTEENIVYVSVKELTVSDHCAIFVNRKINSFVHKHLHWTIIYRSFKQFDEIAFVDDLWQIP